nr:LOW QUALITY PROTEIN: uncharacterized protein C12orf76 homolog [Cavia porcellus]
MPSQMEHTTETMMFTLHRFAGNKGYLMKKDPRMDKDFPGFLENQKHPPLAVDTIMMDADQNRDSKVGFQSFFSLTAGLTTVCDDYFVIHVKQNGKEEAVLNIYFRPDDSSPKGPLRTPEFFSPGNPYSYQSLSRRTVTKATTLARKAGAEAELAAEVASSPLGAGKDVACGGVTVSASVRPPGGAGGGPEPGGAAGTEPAVCSAARAEPGVDGNHFQHSAGDSHPHGILCLQAHSASVTAKQVLPQVFGNRISCDVHGPMENLESELSYSEMTFGVDSW